MTRKAKQALDRAIELAGGQCALGRKISTTQQNIQWWATKPTPVNPRYAVRIEKATGVKVEELRPDLDWVRAKGKFYVEVA